MTNNRKTPRRKTVTRKKRTNGRLKGNMQSIHVNYRELWSPVLSVVGSGDSTPPYLPFVPGNSGLPQLDALGTLYESYRMTGPVIVEYKATASMIISGSVVVGIDYDARDVVLGYPGVAALNPKAVGSVFKDHKVVVTPDRAMNKKWLFCSGQVPGEPAFAVGYSTTSANAGAVGDIWCEYTIEFISPRVPNFRISDSVTLIQPDGTTYSNASDEHNGAPFAHAVAATGSTSSFVSANYVVAPGSPRFLPGVYRLISVNAGGSGLTTFSVNQPGVQLLTINEESAGIFDVFIRLLFDFLPGAIIFNFQKTKAPALAFANSFAIYKAIYGPKGGV